MTDGPFRCGYCPGRNTFDSIEAAREHREEEHPGQAASDGGLRVAHEGVDWPLHVNGHSLAKTHSPGISSQQLACQHCGASAVYTTHDIGVDTTLDDIVRILAARLPADCQALVPQTEASHE